MFQYFTNPTFVLELYLPIFADVKHYALNDVYVGCNSAGEETKTAPPLPKGQKPKAQPLRLRFKNGDIADEFLKKVQELA